MIVSCNNCKKRYRVQAQKLKAPKSTFKCTQCGTPIYVHKPPEVQSRAMSSSIYNTKNNKKGLPEHVLKHISALESAEAQKYAPPLKERFPSNAYSVKTRLTGLWAKMVVFFFLVPAFILLTTNLISLQQLKTLTMFVSQESEALSSSLAEDKISEICRAVASQASIYLKAHPEINAEQFMENSAFKRIVVQRVASDDFTFLFQMPDADGSLRVYAHTDTAFVGKELSRIEQASLSAVAYEDYAVFAKILTGVRGLKESRGSYLAKASDGVIRKKQMVCTPIEGTPYVIAAAAFPDEFTLPVNKFESRISTKTLAIKNFIWMALLSTIFMTGSVVFFYGFRLTRILTELAYLANRISGGDLGVKIDIQRKDEIGDVAHAVGRLQENIRQSLKQIRMRKNEAKIGKMNY